MIVFIHTLLYSRKDSFKVADVWKVVQGRTWIEDPEGLTESRSVEFCDGGDPGLTTLLEF